jgi:Ser/Thr protein kinase RdoA (MazF antagonist)
MALVPTSISVLGLVRIIDPSLDARESSMQSFETLSRRGQLYRLGHLAHTALQQYELLRPQLTSLKHEHNTTFRVRTANREHYVLRIHRPGQHTTEAIHSELLWLTALHQDTELDIPQPVPTKDGALLTIAKVDGVPEPRVCVLFQWLAGRFLDQSLTPTYMERVGIFTAHLHEHTAQWPLPPHFVRGRVDNLTAEARRISRVDPHTASLADLEQHPTDEDIEYTLRLVTELCSTEDGALVNNAIYQIRQMLAELGYSADVFGLIHGDLHQENYLFHRDRVCAIDFDDCGFGHYLFDLNVTLLEIQHLPQYGALRTALLAGYRRVRPLPAAHEAYLGSFFALRRLQLLMWVLESREHPTFRNKWENWAQDELQQLKQLLRAV